MLEEEPPHAIDRRHDVLVHRMPVLGIPDRVRQHLPQLPRAVFGEQPEPCVDRTGHGGSEGASTGDIGEPLDEPPLPLKAYETEARNILWCSGSGAFLGPGMSVGSCAPGRWRDLVVRHKLASVRTAPD